MHQYVGVTCYEMLETFACCSSNSTTCMQVSNMHGWPIYYLFRFSRHTYFIKTITVGVYGFTN